jgi:hypothetical protein
MAAAAKLYGVLDCARAPEMYEHVARLSPESAQCLFEGRLDEAVRRASPHLVELPPADPLSKAWRSVGWGQAWGLLLSSSAALPTVRRRLRHFTMAKLPDGSGPVLFRFWDPRVFRSYMPLVEAEDAAAWFVDIDRYIVEAEDGVGSLRFTLKSGRVAMETGPRITAG